MDRYDYYVEEMRFHLKEPNTLVIRGWFREDNPQNRKLEVRLDGTSLPFRLETRNGVRIRKIYDVSCGDQRRGNLYDGITPGLEKP